MKTYTFTQAEFAVLTQHMLADVLVLNQTAQSDLGINAQQLAEAEARLREHGLLVRGLGDEIAVADELAAMLQTALFPRRLGVLRTTQADRTYPPMYYSFAAESIVRNFVDAHGNHIFDALANINEALDVIVAPGGAQPNESTNGRPVPLETLLPDATALSILMVVDAPAQPRPHVHNFSWLQARGALWFVDAGPVAVTRALPIDFTSLRQTLGQALTRPYAAQT